LFTNVPVDLALQVASRRLEGDSSLAGRTKLSVDNIVNLLTLCPNNATYFTLRGVVYQQVFGTAMGSPVSVVVANLVMEDVEERELRDISTPIFNHMSCYKIFLRFSASRAESECDAQHPLFVTPQVIHWPDSTTTC
jgi:hypothetical protein